MRAYLLPLLALAGCTLITDFDRFGTAASPVAAGDAGHADASELEHDASRGDGGDGGDASELGDAGELERDGGEDAGFPPTDPACAIETNACVTATEHYMGAVIGDTGREMLQANGSGARWLAFDVYELTGPDEVINSTGLVRALVSLTSEDGSEYTMEYVQQIPYVADTCAQPMMSGGSVFEVSELDTTSANGNAPRVYLHIKHVRGRCGAWTLSVAGNSP